MNDEQNNLPAAAEGVRRTRREWRLWLRHAPRRLWSRLRHFRIEPANVQSVDVFRYRDHWRVECQQGDGIVFASITAPDLQAAGRLIARFSRPAIGAKWLGWVARFRGRP
ncbi:MAG: hypothetical protein ACREU9_00020 [Gammaproteobacteria bacterium]